MTPNGVQLIAAERERQQAVEGFDAGHDREYTSKQLAKAAVSYLLYHIRNRYLSYTSVLGLALEWWPWAEYWFKPAEDDITNLVKAGALVAAEIDRIHTAQYENQATKKTT